MEIQPPMKKSDSPALLPPEWDPVQAANEVMDQLITVTAPQVKGAHDADMVLLGDHAYIVYMANDLSAGEGSVRTEIYDAMSIVNLNTLKVEAIIPIAHSEQAFENETLPVGTCYVCRIIRKDDTTLRCFFSSTHPGHRQSQIWYRDFDWASRTFENRIHRAKIKTAAGTFDMQPQYFHADAVAQGFRKEGQDNGIFPFDIKVFDGKYYVGVNNFKNGQNALALLLDDLATFEILGHFNEPQELYLNEPAINRLPDGTWMAICRQRGGNHNYTFTTSPDGRNWTVGEHRDFVPNGEDSKPTFDRFNSVYYLGWQERHPDDLYRRIFNIDVSLDCMTWERKYHFETPKSFQYPTFREHNGSIWLALTQGDYSEKRKERIMFGKLEDLTAG